MNQLSFFALHVTSLSVSSVNVVRSSAHTFPYSHFQVVNFQHNLLIFYRTVTRRETNSLRASYRFFSLNFSNSYYQVKKYKSLNYWECDERFTLFASCGNIMKLLDVHTSNNSHCGTKVTAWYKESPHQWCYAVGLLRKYSDKVLNVEIFYSIYCVVFIIICKVYWKSNIKFLKFLIDFIHRKNPNNSFAIRR